MSKRYEFDDAEILSPFAIGVPGKRSFFIAIGHAKDWVRVWVEKEELQTIGRATKLLLTGLPGQNPGAPDERGHSPPVASRIPSAEVEIDEVSLSYDGSMACLNGTVRVLGPQRLDAAQLNCRFTVAQLTHFCEQADAVCAAGRPHCPLCGGVIESHGHSCPRAN